MVASQQAPDRNSHLVWRHVAGPAGARLWRWPGVSRVPKQWTSTWTCRSEPAHKITLYSSTYRTMHGTHVRHVDPLCLLFQRIDQSLNFLQHPSQHQTTRYIDISLSYIRTRHYTHTLVYSKFYT